MSRRLPAGISAPQIELLAPEDPPPVVIERPDGGAQILLICDHAGRAIPNSLSDLGLAAGELDRHIAWDIGAEAVARHLAALFDAPLVVQRYSRLVIDCNRSLDDPTAIAQISDGTTIPGNLGLTPAERAARAAAIHAPYHAAIGAERCRLSRRGPGPAILSVHSFTPVMSDFARPWHIGLLWNRDGRIALPLLRSLRAQANLTIGDNEPYSGRDGHGYTMHVHPAPHDLPHILLEIRQDLIADETGASHWAALLHRHLRPILAALDLVG